MNQLEALTEAPPKAVRRASSAPAAADWLQHPIADSEGEQMQLIKQLAEEPEYTCPTKN